MEQLNEENHLIFYLTLLLLHCNFLNKYYTKKFKVLFQREIEGYEMFALFPKTNHWKDKSLVFSENVKNFTFTCMQMLLSKAKATEVHSGYKKCLIWKSNMYTHVYTLLNVLSVWERNVPKVSILSG